MVKPDVCSNFILPQISKSTEIVLCEGCGWPRYMHDDRIPQPKQAQEILMKTEAILAKTANALPEIEVPSRDEWDRGY